MKKLLLPIALFVTVSVANASQLDVNDALAVAKDFYSKNVKLPINSVSLVHIETVSPDDEQVLYYVFDINNNNGYVVVPADKNQPISDYAGYGHYVVKRAVQQNADSDLKTVTINNWSGSSWAARSKG